MNPKTPGPPDRDLEEVFAAERSFRGDDVAAQQMAWARLEGTIAAIDPPTPAAGDAGGPGGVNAQAVTSASASGIAAVAGKPIVIAVAAYVVGLGSGVGVSQLAVSKPDEPVPPAREAAPLSDVGRLKPPLLVGPEKPLSTPQQPAQRPAAPRVSARREVAPAASRTIRSRLAKEQTVIDAARAALASKHHEETLEILARHRRDFPNGQLAEERDGLLVVALIKAGRRREAGSAFESFKRSYPRSLLLPAIENAVAQTP